MDSPTLLRYGLRYLGHTTVFMLGIISIIATGGDSSSSGPDNRTEIPIQLSLENLNLSAGVPTTVTYTISVTGGPYTQVEFDAEKTLQSATIDVTPTPVASPQ
jgi:hypothetical protein